MMLSNILAIIASGFGAWAVFKYLILIEIRIEENTFKTLFDLFKNQRQIVLSEEFVSDERHPIEYSSFCFFRGIPWFYIYHNERLMQAGFSSKDYITTIYCLRWQYKNIKKFLKEKLKQLQLTNFGIPVELMMPYGVDKIGSLKETPPPPIVNEFLWKDFEKEVIEVVAGDRKKTSALLYGPPGNGKTSLVKYLATTYRLPIMIFTLNPDWTNHDLLLLFSQIPKKCIVLFEDFDNYFDGRKCILGGGENKQIKFTFDIILNGLDGVYNTYENVVFIMTVNDINKVDDALKNRPSRFKFTRHFDNPNIEIRKKILPEDWVQETNGYNLDQIFRLKEYYDNGKDLNKSKLLLNKEA